MIIGLTHSSEEPCKKEMVTKAQEAKQELGKELKAELDKKLSEDSEESNESVKTVEAADAHLSLDGARPELRKFAETCAHVYQCPIDWIIVCQYAAVGLAVGNNLKIDSGNYINSTALWYGIVGRSGDGKSEPMDVMLKPITVMQSNLEKKYSENYKKWKATPEKQRGEEPKDIHYVEDKCTPESQLKSLSENPRGILVMRDEMSSMFVEMDAYNKSGFDKTMLSLWDGRSTSVRRKSSPPIIVEKPYYSILGGIQPGVLQEAMGRKSFLYSGLLSRFLWCYVDNNRIRQRVNEPVPEEQKEYWKQYIISLWNMGQAKLTLSEEANRLYNDFYDELERKRVATDGYMPSVYSKLEIQVLRWAGITQLMREGNEKLDSKVIDGTAMEQSIKAMRLFEGWAKKVYEVICSDGVHGKLTKEQVIILLNEYFPIKNQKLFAQSLGGAVDRTTISKALKKAKNAS